MNFDETLAFVAADIIAEAWKGRKISFSHRRGLFQMYNDDSGLEGMVAYRVTGPVLLPVELIDEYEERYIQVPDCMCPPWIDCYCGGREVDEDTTSD